MTAEKRQAKSKRSIQKYVLRLCEMFKLNVERLRFDQLNAVALSMRFGLVEHLQDSPSQNGREFRRLF